MPDELCVWFSVMAPADGDGVAILHRHLRADRAVRERGRLNAGTRPAALIGALTCWLITMVTTPLELTRAMICSVTPELWLLMVLAKTELPPDCTPLDSACE